MGEIGRVAQQGIQIAHHRDHGARLTVALLAVLDGQETIHHLVNVSAVLGKIELATSVIVILFHKIFSVRPAESASRRVPHGRVGRFFGREA